MNIPGSCKSVESVDILIDDNDVNDNVAVNCLDEFLNLCYICFATAHIVT